MKRLELVEKRTKEALELYRKRKVPSAVYLEASGICNAKCIYCDLESGKSSKGELSTQEKVKLVHDLCDMGTISFETCGMGEPTLDKGYFPMVEAMSEREASSYFFTNGTLINEKKARFIHDHNVSLLVKLDSLNPKNFDYILGKKGLAQNTYKGIENLLATGNWVKEKENCIKTRLGASIVITPWNIKDIPDVVRYCKDNGMFPLVAKMEKMGRAINIENNITEDDYKKLLNNINNILGYDYSAISYKCPVSIGMRIDNCGNVLISSNDGMGCAFSQLENIEYDIIGNVKKNNLKEMWEKILSLREDKKEKIIQLTEKVKNYPCFGGCGNRRDMLEDYINCF